MSAYHELAPNRSSRERELEREIGKLEGTVKEQADIIEDLKKKLFDGSCLNESEILATNNKISSQETRILQYTIDELRETIIKAKEDAASVREQLETEKQLCRSQAKEIEKWRQKCETLSEELKRARTDLKTSQKAASEDAWSGKEQILRNQFKMQLDKRQNQILALNAKVKDMRDRETSLRTENRKLQKSLEEAQFELEKARESVKEQRVLAAKDSEVNVIRKQLEEVIQLEKSKGYANKDAAVTTHIEALVDELKRMKENSNYDQRMVEILNEVGSLRATKSFLEKQVAQSENAVKELSEQLDKERLLVEQEKEKVAQLEEKVADCEKNAEITHRYLLEDMAKVKQDKAKLRCQFIELRREHNRLLGAHGEQPLETSTISISTTDESTVCHECAILKKELGDMRTRLRVVQKEDKAVEASFIAEKQESNDEREGVEMQKAIISRMEKELAFKDGRIVEQGKALHVLDEQCERLLQMKKAAEAGRKKAKEQLDVMRQELDDAKRELDRRVQVDVDVDLLRQEKDRLAKKVTYLTEELRETHTDYREELATLARKMSENKRKDATENEAYAAKVEQLQAEIRQLETTVRSLERQCLQLKEESGQQTKQVSDVQDVRSRLIDENNKLREGLATAISKAERYKEDSEASKEGIATLKEELRKTKEAKCDADLMIEQLNQTLADRERLTAYLQSQIRMKSATKLKKSSSRSTLMSASDISVTEVAVPETKASKSQGITGCGDEKGVALLRDTYTFADDTSMPSKSFLDQQGYAPAVPSAPAYMGTMKHDIPHRWKTYLVLKQVKCVVCLEGLPRVRHAMKCAECGILVHRGCSVNISNTCGLPSACADFYLDSQANSVSTMSGWVKLWRSGDRASNKWRSAWATMDENSIRFYDNDGLANANVTDSPFLQLNLDHDQWRLHMQSVADVGVKGSLSKESYALLIEIRMANDSLFMLAPTSQAKQRWVRALQRATNKKMFVQRQASSSGDGNSMLLGLDAPLNLSINCAQVMNDWLLIGAQEGLFITQLSSLRVPFVITGLTAVFHMEFLPELQMLIAISGSNRQLFALHASDVYNCFNSDRPAVRPTPIANYTACHLIAVLRDSSQKIGWLCVADPDQVHILQFNSRLGIFSPFKSLPTTEPAMCLLSVPNGFVFGTDQFYYVNVNELIARPLVVPGCGPDWPLAVLAVNDKELLLAYHNYGVFADIQGNRTRAENIDWNRAPLEFVYSAPFLYVVHFETLEILRVADYTGPNSRCLLDEREVYRCQSAHYLGRGRTTSEILFSLSAKERTEVHSFTRPFEKKMLPSSLKRRQATDTDSLAANPDKRSRK